MMRVKIKETGEIKEIGITDPKTGLNYVSDFVGNAGGFLEDFENVDGEDYYLATAETVEWWEKVIEVHEYVKEVVHVIENSDGVDGVDKAHSLAAIGDAMSQDLDYFQTKKDFEDWLLRNYLSEYKFVKYSDLSFDFRKK